ncbi:hypothetical protein niasHT_025599 [Heterodera trifolii]|uniref:Homeobox domain-containing protein n=1 Tax=Heterodera trifolii TaxID=157864 RepID=A0ABD2JYU0_9BILA
MCFQLPPELLSELANAFCFDFRWSVLRVSSSIFDHFLAKRQQKILQNIELKFQQLHEQHGGSDKDNVGQKLANFQNKISLPISNVPIHEAVLAARVLSSVHTGNFNHLYAFLESHKFVRQIHPKLQKIWWDVHFLEAEKSELSPLEKYKVREKYPLPPTIRDGQRKNGFFSENTMALLNEQFIKKNYLSQDERWHLAEATGLSTAQIGNWLKNQRMKEKKAERARMLAYFAKMSADELEEKRNELWAMHFQLPPELLSELANAFRFDFRWSVLRVSSSIFDHFLAKRQQKILQNIELYFQQALNSRRQYEKPKNVGQHLEHLSNFRNKIFLTMSNVSMHEAVLTARVLFSIHTGNFNELYAFLEGQKFAQQIYPKLQKIWWDVHFLETEKTLGKSELSPLEMYKVRVEHPLPAAIWDGKQKKGFFNENTKTLLNEQFIRKNYLSQAARWELAEATGLSTAQIKNWFTNRRSKQKKTSRLAYFAQMSLPAELEEEEENDELLGPKEKKKRKETEE